MSSSDIAISVRKVSKSYTIAHNRQKYTTLVEEVFSRLRNPSRPQQSETFWALNDVSFDIQVGDIVGIIGRNGAGKSTLLKILSRITVPTKGEIDVYGRIGSLLEVGTGFHPELTGRENVFLNGAILGMRRWEIQKQFDAIVDFAGVEKFLDTPVKRYSSGMYVRLAFAVAAHLNPEILIVDEVLAVGDSEFQKKCLGKIKDVSEHGRTVLFVSHQMQAITQLTKRCLFMSQGQVFFDGPTWEAARIYDSMGRRANLAKHVYQAVDKTGNYLKEATVHTSEGSGLHMWKCPIRFEFVFNIDDPQASLSFSFQIMNQLNQPTCHFWLFDNSASFRKEAGLHRVVFTIPNFRLFMGNYTVNAWLSEKRINRLIENVRDICEFSVSMANTERPEYPWIEGDCAYLDEFEVTSELVESGAAAQLISK